MNKLIKFSEATGMTWLVPIIRLIARDNPREQMRQIFILIGVPLLGVLIFLGLWSQVASTVKVGFGSLPGPTDVWNETKGLWGEHKAERAKEVEFYKRQSELKKRFEEKFPDKAWTARKFSGKPTYIDQIFTSLKTVFTGFVIASLIAVPLGILCGLSKVVNTAVNPFIQIFKPVSPLAWLPIVMIMVSALYNPQEPMFAKSFVTSALTVMLCCLWPTMINTAVGVANISQDLQNVSKVLRLSWFTHVVKIVLPSAIPMIFTGLRLSFGIAWMVLIAAEMLAQNPGLGKFVWDEFQNGSSNSLGRIMVAVIVIGILGYLLDRGMLMIQKYVSWDKSQALR